MPKRIKDYIHGDPPKQDWVSIDHAAATCNIPAKTLRDDAELGRIKSVRLGERLAVELGEVRILAGI